jgi:hypothetical protein
VVKWFVSAKYTSSLIGTTKPNNGDGLTVDDLITLLRRLPSRARQNYIMADCKDVIGISIGQSDQAETWELKIHLLLDEGHA